jgi:predicted sulfurtransferase
MAPKSLELVNIIQNNVKLNEWIVHFDMEHAKNKNTATYLTDKDVSYKINDEINSDIVAQINVRNQSANLPRQANRVVRNEIDEFLKKYKII